MNARFQIGLSILPINHFEPDLKKSMLMKNLMDMWVMKKVSFTSMDQGTKDDYDLVAIHDSQNERGLSKRAGSKSAVKDF